MGPFDDEEFFRPKSPLFHADNIVRPLMVLQGANDPRVLKAESDDIVAAGQANGVPVEYVVFEDEGHGFARRRTASAATRRSSCSPTAPQVDRTRHGRLTPSHRLSVPWRPVPRGPASFFVLCRVSLEVEDSPMNARRSKLRGMAAEADRYDLYQRAVQAPDADVEFFDGLFETLRGRAALTLREDFAGTAYLSSAWVASHPERRAVAIDVDAEPLDWGYEHNLMEPEVGARVELVEGDARTLLEPPVDIVCAPNFSVCCLRERASLLEYLASAHASLVEDGLLICELYGGTEAVVASTEERHCDGFDYTWEQESFNPVDHHVRCHIHFDFTDGSRLDSAFTYDFRLWSIPEISEALTEVGFAEVQVYWEAVGEDGAGTGEYRLTRQEENQEGWLVYIVGLR